MTRPRNRITGPRGVCSTCQEVAPLAPSGLLAPHQPDWGTRPCEGEGLAPEAVLEAPAPRELPVDESPNYWDLMNQVFRK